MKFKANNVFQNTHLLLMASQNCFTHIFYACCYVFQCIQVSQLVLDNLLRTTRFQAVHDYLRSMTAWRHVR